MYEGTIKSLVFGRGFGFIAEPGQPDCFFHASQLVDLEWSEQLQGQRVRFDRTETAKGPAATGVKAAD